MGLDGSIEGEEDNSDESQDDEAEGEEAKVATPKAAMVKKPAVPTGGHVGTVQTPGISFLRANCLTQYKHVHDAEELCATLGFNILVSWDIVSSDDNARIGKLHMSFQGRTLAAACRQHSHCKFLLDVKRDYKRTEAWLVKWLIAGGSLNAEEHALLREEVKLEAGSVREAELSSAAD